MNQLWVVLGEEFEANEDQSAITDPMAFGDFERRSGDYIRHSGSGDYWVATRETLETMVELTPSRQLDIVKRLRKERQTYVTFVGSGPLMVKGVVQRNPHKPNPTARVRKYNVADLQDRARRLVIQISTAIQAGDPSEGQMRQFTTQYAELQAERNEALEMLASVEDDLKIGRAIIFDYSDPRSISAASG